MRCSARGRRRRRCRRCRAPNTPTATITPFQKHKEYRLVAKKGEGTFSEVIKAQDVRTGRAVAIKCMKNRFESAAQVEALREVQALRRLSPHAHVVRLLEVLFDQPTGRLALVFELMVRPAVVAAAAAAVGGRQGGRHSGRHSRRAAVLTETTSPTHTIPNTTPIFNSIKTQSNHQRT